MRMAAARNRHETIWTSLSIIVHLVCIYIVKVSSSGEFQVRLRSFENDAGRTAEGNCCREVAPPTPDTPDVVSSTSLPVSSSSSSSFPTSSSSSSTCHSQCRTYFRICLSHYQTNISLTSRCTYGEKITKVFGNNSFVLPMTSHDSSDFGRDIQLARNIGAERPSTVPSTVYLTGAGSSENNVVRLPFKITWPGTYTLIIEAWNSENGDLRSAGQSDQSSALISRFAIQQFLSVSDSWNNQTTIDKKLLSSPRLEFDYRVVCDKDYYGPGCAVTCLARDDQLGHYRCDPQDGRPVCLNGWNGHYCEKAVCLPGCHKIHGQCSRPNECQCRLGWQGKLCDKCIPYPGCRKGSCQQPWQCNCEEGWGGLFCNQDLNFCTNNKPCRNGATCSNTGQGSYTCSCMPGFTGTNCELQIAVCTPTSCLHGGICKVASGGLTSRCECSIGFYGQLCESTAVHRCRDKPCSNGATCENISDNRYRCLCAAGFTGSHCEIEIDECLFQPCENGGRCVDEIGSFRCICPAGFSGATCGQNNDECAFNPCLSGATCRDKVDDFECICPKGYFGSLCQYTATDIGTISNGCSNFTCANGASCQPDIDFGFRCFCATGFTGWLCEMNVNDCAPDICHNGGTCVDLVNDFECVCAPGYYGSRCRWTSDSGRTVVPDQTMDGEIAEAIVAEKSLTMRQVLLVGCLSSGISVVLIALIVVLFILRRRHRLARTNRENLHNEKMRMNNLNIYPGDENAQILPSGKIYTKNLVNFDSQRTNHNELAEVHSRQIRNVCNSGNRVGSAKELNTICTNVPLLSDAGVSFVKACDLARGSSLKCLNEYAGLKSSNHAEQWRKSTMASSGYRLCVTTDV